jgi:hypothetical protein
MLPNLRLRVDDESCRELELINKGVQEKENKIISLFELTVILENFKESHFKISFFTNPRYDSEIANTRFLYLRKYYGEKNRAQRQKF